jgi:hypothetical protein
LIYCREKEQKMSPTARWTEEKEEEGDYLFVSPMPDSIDEIQRDRN